MRLGLSRSARALSSMRQVAKEFIAGESLYALSKRHDISRQLIRVWFRSMKRAPWTKTPRLPIYSRNTKPRLRRWSAWLAAHRSNMTSVNRLLQSLRLMPIWRRRPGILSVGERRPRRTKASLRSGRSSHHLPFKADDRRAIILPRRGPSQREGLRRGLRLLQAKFSCNFNQVSRGRIRRFESDIPSQPVRSLRISLPCGVVVAAGIRPPPVAKRKPVRQRNYP
jgi:hypothetical protein